MLAAVFKRLRFAGVSIVTLPAGEPMGIPAFAFGRQAKQAIHLMPPV